MIGRIHVASDYTMIHIGEVVSLVERVRTIFASNVKPSHFCVFGTVTFKCDKIHPVVQRHPHVLGDTVDSSGIGEGVTFCWCSWCVG